MTFTCISKSRGSLLSETPRLLEEKVPVEEMRWFLLVVTFLFQTNNRRPWSL